MSVYSLKVFVKKQDPNTSRALNNLKRFCEDHLFNKYEIEVIDIYEHPEIASKYNVFETPTLIKESPPPVKMLISDLSDYQELLITILSVEPKSE